MNLIASIQGRLRNQSRQSGISFATVLEQFALSRFFARLAQSDYSDSFILKGAQLFRLLEPEGHRPTRDADFHSFGIHDSGSLKEIFTKICQLVPEKEDALSWENIRATAIRDENSYGGLRILIMCYIGKVKIPLQFDIGFGDIITPEVRFQKWSALLDYEDVSLATYPMETVIAEKLEAAISLGINNSRMKDFYDLHWLQSHLEFNGDDLRQAVTNTFARRSTVIPDKVCMPFSEEFSSDKQKIEQWSAFLRKGNLSQMELSDALSDIEKFLLPVLNNQVSDRVWTPEKNWHLLSNIR